MVKYFRIFFSFIFLVLLIKNSAAQVSITAQVFAEVISSNTATEVAQLNFGKFSPGISGGKIIISPQGILTSAGTVVPGASQHNAGTFNISGDAAGTFVVTLPDEPVILTEISGSKTMQVIDWVSDPPSGSNITLVEGGTQTVYVGATLVVGNIIDNPSGLYSGTYSITFDYN